MSKVSKLLAVSALAFAAGFFGTTQLQAGQALPGDIIIAQSSSGGGGDGTSGTQGTVGSRDGTSGSQKMDQSNKDQPKAPVNPKDATVNVPSQCVSITEAIARADCIRRNAPAQSTGSNP